VGLSVADDAKASIRRPTNIPAQSLVPALKELAHERGIQVVFQSEVVGATRTHGAVGELTTAEALTQLLEGTNLVYRYLDDRTITILKASDVSSPGAAPAQPDSAPANPTPGSGKEGMKRTLTPFLLAQATSGQAAGSSAVENKTAQSATEKPELLQEVIVTAQKRQERLIDVPQSVTVLSASDLIRLGATQFSDFANTVPGLSYQTAGAGFTSVTLR
jgi:hypothetical protein